MLRARGDHRDNLQSRTDRRRNSSRRRPSAIPRGQSIVFLVEPRQSRAYIETIYGIKGQQYLKMLVYCLSVWIGGLACGVVNVLTCGNADLSASTDAATVDLPNKRYVVCNQNGRPLQMLLCEGQLNDHVDVRLMVDAMPRVKVLIADKGYDSDYFREALEECGVTPCIPPRRNRKVLIACDMALYKPDTNRVPSREAQGLEVDSDKIRSLFLHLLFGNLYRRHLRLLSQSMSPELSFII